MQTLCCFVQPTLKKPKDSDFTVRGHLENHHILTIEKLQPENIICMNIEYV